MDGEEKREGGREREREGEGGGGRERERKMFSLSLSLSHTHSLTHTAMFWFLHSQGFWDLVSIQVDELCQKFENLAELERNDWKQPQPMEQNQVKKEER